VNGHAGISHLGFIHGDVNQGSSFAGLPSFGSVFPTANPPVSHGVNGRVLHVSTSQILCSANDGGVWANIPPSSLGEAGDGNFLGLQDVVYVPGSDIFVHALQFEKSLVLVTWSGSSLCKVVCLPVAVILSYVLKS